MRTWGALTVPADILVNAGGVKDGLPGQRHRGCRLQKAEIAPQDGAIVVEGDGPGFALPAGMIGLPAGTNRGRPVRERQGIGRGVGGPDARGKGRAAHCELFARFARERQAGGRGRRGEEAVRRGLPEQEAQIVAGIADRMHGGRLRQGQKIGIEGGFPLGRGEGGNRLNPTLLRAGVPKGPRQIAQRGLVILQPTGGSAPRVCSVSRSSVNVIVLSFSGPAIMRYLSRVYEKAVYTIL